MVYISLKGLMLFFPLYFQKNPLYFLNGRRSLNFDQKLPIFDVVPPEMQLVKIKGSAPLQQKM